jgi:diketogulonate reductase-like aldo/keto reductase
MTTAIPFITLNNGVQLPALGLGVFESPPAQTTAAIAAAIACGYPLIETAASYLNEREVGVGILHSGVDRAKLFIQTKLWIGDYGCDSALRAHEVSLRKLGLGFVPFSR